MNWFIALLLGLFIGWLVEWVIDWLYWRRRLKTTIKEYEDEHQVSLMTISRLRSLTKHGGEPDSDMQTKIDNLTALNKKNLEIIANLQTQQKEFAIYRNRSQEMILQMREQLKEAAIFKKRSLQTIIRLQKELDNAGHERPKTLQDIRGIGPVIEGKLNAAGIYTFEDLAHVSSEKLEEIVGKRIRNLVDEDNLIRQARELSGEV